MISNWHQSVRKWKRIVEEAKVGEKLSLSADCGHCDEDFKGGCFQACPLGNNRYCGYVSSSIYKKLTEDYRFGGLSNWERVRLAKAMLREIKKHKDYFYEDPKKRRMKGRRKK